MPKYILASQSPRRKQLLEWAEIEFEVIVHETDESYPSNLNPTEVAIHIARQKALAVFSSNPNGRTVIAADTIVVLGNEIIGKPKNQKEAIKILSRLSGQHHQVITGVVLLNGNKEISFCDVTDVEFHIITSEQIRFYVEKYNPMDKACTTLLTGKPITL